VLWHGGESGIGCGRGSGAGDVHRCCGGGRVLGARELGDKAGWTIMGNSDYDAWVVSKKFQLGYTVGESSPPTCLLVSLLPTIMFCFPVI
jgi:hypothetical protein